MVKLLIKMRYNLYINMNIFYKEGVTNERVRIRKRIN